MAKNKQQSRNLKMSVESYKNLFGWYLTEMQLSFWYYKYILT